MKVGDVLSGIAIGVAASYVYNRFFGASSGSPTFNLFSVDTNGLADVATDALQAPLEWLSLIDPSVLQNRKGYFPQIMNPLPSIEELQANIRFAYGDLYEGIKESGSPINIPPPNYSEWMCPVPGW